MALSEDLVNAKPPLVIEKITMTTMQMLLANESKRVEIQEEKARKGQ